MTADPSEPTFQQALAQLTQTIERGIAQQNEKIEILSDQIGHLSEGLTEIRLLVQEQGETAEKHAEAAKQHAEAARQQAEAAKQQSEVARQQAETIKSLADSVSSLVALLKR